MGLRRDARKHQTLAVQAAQTEQWWEHSPGDRVRTIDGPGRVEAVYDGPFPGSEEYEIRLEGGLGGGRYDAGQIEPLGGTEASVEHTAAEDYPELGTLLHDRPDPAKIRYTARLEYQDGPDGGLSLTPGAVSTEGGEDGQVMRDMGQYHSDPAGDFSLASLSGGGEGGEGDGLPGVDSEGYSDHLYHRPEEHRAARAFDDYHPDQVYLRFGHWPKDERSSNNVTGFPEEGVSVYDLDHNGDPMDPDPDLSRGHEHDQHCEPDCDLDSWNEDFGNDAGQEMRDRTGRAEQARRRGVPAHHPDVGHLVKGEMVGIGHDGEPLLKNVRRVGDWMDHRHLFVPGAEPHRLARTPADDDYEDPAEKPTPHTARSVNGEEIDQHGSAPGWHRAANPNVYDRQSTEGEPDPQWIEEIDKRQHAMAARTQASSHIDREISRMEAVGDPDEPGYAHMTDGGILCPSCKDERSETDTTPVSWRDLRSGGSEGGEYCDDCMEELTPPRPHSKRHCNYGEDCESADEAHDENLKRQERRDYLKGNAHHFDAKTLKDLHEDLDPIRDRPVTPRGPDEAPLHMSEEEERHRDFGGHDDFHTTLMEKRDWQDHLKRRDSAENQLKDLFSGPEFDQHRRFMENNPGRPTHLSSRSRPSSLPRVTAHSDEHENLGPTPEDVERLRQHMITDHGYTHDQIGGLPDNGQEHPLHMEHELEHDASTYEGGVGGGEFGSGEQGGGMPHVHKPHEPEQRSGYAPFPEVPQGYAHPAWGGSHNPGPVDEFIPAEVDPDEALGHPSALSMLVTAATDPSFRFHVTAAWRDVQAKAKRIRSSGGVSIKHSDGMTVVADVQGDHDVYETALQRAPGRRQSVAVYACGCKWGAYHWGASDDLSRFAGRMCSHALALQYEASSRGMFGRDVEVDDTRPRWVPSKVVVKYDIDTGQHIRATAAVPEQPPVLVALAAMDGDPVTARVVIAAVNDMFGDTSGYTEPSLMDPMGPTQPWDHQESPASAGNLKAAEPDNWGSITAPTMLPKISRALATEAFWQAIVPIVRAVAPKVIKNVAPQAIEKAVEKAAPRQVEEADPAGARATLNDEPEGALPETDGEHTASLGDVDIVSDHDLWSVPDDALSPENPSMQTQGSAADIVAEFQRSAAAKHLMDSGPKGDASGKDIAQAAQEYLAKTAVTTSFTRAEQDALINESPGVQASNTDRLNIVGTHYEELDKLAADQEEDDAVWLM